MALLVFPNPTSNEVTISLPEEFIGKNIGLFDYTGRLVYSTIVSLKDENLSMLHFASGTYFLQVQDLPKIATIVKQ
jgi:hypothetical protein